MKDMSMRKYNKTIIISLCVIVAFSMLLACSANSFFYEFNDWVDFNWYRTVARGILEGKLPYKDMFEQKGPIIYYVYAICEMLPNPVLAIFALEVISLSFYSYLAYKFFNKKLSRFASFVGMIILTFITVCWWPFITGGGAVEEFFLPFIMYFIIVQQEYFDGVEISRKRAVLIGILVSIIFWTKYTVLIIPAVILLVWLVLKMIKKEYKSAFDSILFMFIGFVSVSVIIILFFAVNGALGDLFYDYFYLNLFCYNNETSKLQKYISILKDKTWLFLLVIIAISALVSLLVLLFKKKRNMFLMVLAPISQFVFFLIKVDTLYMYYLLILMPFMSLILMFVLGLFDKIKLYKGFEIAIVCIMFTGLLFFTFMCSNPIYDLNRKKSEYIQFQVAKDIESFGINNYSVFCYDMLDYGFYNACGVIPTEKYFARNNFTKEGYPEMFESFDNAIVEKRNDFVLMLKSDYMEKFEFVGRYYSFVNEYSHQYFESIIDIKTLDVVLLYKR